MRWDRIGIGNGGTGMSWVGWDRTRTGWILSPKHARKIGRGSAAIRTQSPTQVASSSDQKPWAGWTGIDWTCRSVQQKPAAGSTANSSHSSASALMAQGSGLWAT